LLLKQFPVIIQLDSSSAIPLDFTDGEHFAFIGVLSAIFFIFCSSVRVTHMLAHALALLD
jgi:hypothetical protein